MQESAIEGITLTQVQGGTALTALEPEDVAKTEIASIMRMAFRFANAREAAMELDNTKAFADVLFKVREASSDPEWFNGFLGQLDQLPPTAFSQLSTEGLQNIAALAMANGK